MKVKPAVKALVEREGRILVLKTETEGRSYWVLPGGKIEYGEEPLEALQRELREELSTKADIGEPVGMYHFFTGENDNGDQIVLTVFEADIDGEIDISDNPADENIAEYRWMKPEELIQRSENESLRELIKSYSPKLPKLVRDGIPEIIRDDGLSPSFHSLEDGDAREYLVEKIVEEANELKEDEDLGELADLLEVIERYKELEDLSEVELERLRQNKAEERGRFEKNIVLEDIEPSENN